MKRDSLDVKNAIAVLNRGREKLGNIISLEMQLFNLYKNRSNFEAAHAVLDRMMAPLSRKERLMVEKAALLLFQGEPLKAKETLANAENAIASLPARFQNLGATIKLKERITELKQQL